MTTIKKGLFMNIFIDFLMVTVNLVISKVCENLQTRMDEKVNKIIVLVHGKNLLPYTKTVFKTKEIRHR